MNLDKEIKNFKGQTYEMSYPSRQDIENIKEEKNIEKVRSEDLPRETIRNVLINSLSNYTIEDKKEVFLVHKTGAWLLDNSEEEIPKEVLKFLTKSVLPEATSRIEEDKEGNKVEKGIYKAWVIGKVYEELGVNE